MELIRKSDALHAVLHNTGDAAVAAVQMIPSAWIKCSERLPEPRFAREWYLVALESGCVKTLAFEKAENRWHETGSPVTHWMPLPDAPEVAE